MGFIDSFLNKITMYRLVLYVVFLLWIVALVFSIVGVLPFAVSDMVFTLVLILLVSIGSNALFAKWFNAVTNLESVYVTAFILALILEPVGWQSGAPLFGTASAALWATASKYLFAYKRKHIFNPAAFGVLVSGLLFATPPTWWVAGRLPLLPFVLVGGLLVTRKIRRFDVVFAFAAAALLTVSLITQGTIAHALQGVLLHTSFFFLALIMLTEPLTMPPTRGWRLVYGALVGVLFTPNLHLGPLFSSPEIALCVGNLLVLFVSPKGRYLLPLIEKKLVATNTYEFVFKKVPGLAFTAGQYLEWTLPDARPDSRGNRRFFTIASSPTEAVVRLGVKVYDQKSSFKTKLLALPEGESLSVSNIAGDFTLPKDKNQKLVFLAGGIGVTPFRSMVKHLIDTHERRDIHLFYSNKTVAEIAYRDVFDRAETVGVTTHYAVTGEAAPAGMMSGFITGDMLKAQVRDYRDRHFYISGPHAMVEAFTKTLREMGVSRLNITTDYFPGFV